MRPSASSEHAPKTTTSIRPQRRATDARRGAVVSQRQLVADSLLRVPDAAARVRLGR